MRRRQAEVPDLVQSCKKLEEQCGQTRYSVGHMGGLKGKITDWSSIHQSIYETVLRYWGDDDGFGEVIHTVKLVHESKPGEESKECAHSGTQSLAIKDLETLRDLPYHAQQDLHLSEYLNPYQARHNSQGSRSSLSATSSPAATSWTAMGKMWSAPWSKSIARVYTVAADGAYKWRRLSLRATSIFA